MNENKKNILKNIDDNCGIYNILCIKSHLYYKRLSYTIHITLVTISSLIIILNTIIKDIQILSTLNIIFNLLASFLFILNCNLNFDSKSNDFKNYQYRFFKIQYDCDKILDNIEDGDLEETIELSQNIYTIKKNYNDIIINMIDIPYHIRKNIYNRFKNDIDYDKMPKILLSYN